MPYNCNELTKKTHFTLISKNFIHTDMGKKPSAHFTGWYTFHSSLTLKTNVTLASHMFLVWYESNSEPDTRMEHSDLESAWFIILRSGNTYIF